MRSIAAMILPSFAVSLDLRPKPINDAVQRGERRGLIRIGAFTRRRIRTSILRRTASKGQRASVKRKINGKTRKVQKVARPGAPPIVRSRSARFTLRNVRFAYEQASHAVYIGSIKVQTRSKTINSVGTTPGLLEAGGTGTVMQWKPDGSSSWSLGYVRRPGVKIRQARARYNKHPFAGPGLEAEVRAGTIGDSFEGVVY